MTSSWGFRVDAILIQDSISAMSTTVEIDGKGRKISQDPIGPNLNASSTGYNDEEKVPSSPGQDSHEHDEYNPHDSRTLETQSLAGSQLPPPPDGGLHAWLKVFGGFLVYINIWYGAFVADSRSILTRLIGDSRLPMAHSNLTTRSPYFPTSRHRQSHG